MGVMKIAGWIGFVVLILTIISSSIAIISFIGSDLSSGLIVADEESNAPIDVILFIILIAAFLLSMFFLYGFVKMGQHVKSRLLKNCAWILVSILAIMIILISLGFFMGGSSDSTKQNDTSLTKSLIILGAIGAFLIFVITVSTLFYVGMIDAGQRIKFARASGITGVLSLSIIPILSTIGLTVSSFGALIIILNPAVSITALKAAYITPAVINLLFGCVLLTFMSLSLLSASREFESENKNVSQTVVSTHGYPAQQLYNEHNSGVQPTNQQYLGLQQATLQPVNAQQSNYQ